LTAEGRAQAEAAAAVGPALKACTRTRTATPDALACAAGWLEGAAHLAASLASREGYAAKHRRTASLTRSAPPLDQLDAAAAAAGDITAARAFARVAAAAEDAWTPELRAALAVLADAGMTRQAAPRLQAEAGQ
jgi:hypothetical protein